MFNPAWPVGRPRKQPGSAPAIVFGAEHFVRKGERTTRSAGSFHLFVTGQEKSMKKKIREKLEKMGLVFSAQSPTVSARVDSGFVELCVIQRKR